MKTYCGKNRQGQEVIFNTASTPVKYIDAVLEDERRGFLPKGLYSSKEQIERHEEWCNTSSEGLYNIPKLEGVVVPDGTFKRLGINYIDKPVLLKYDENT